MLPLTVAFGTFTFAWFRPRKLLLPRDKKARRGAGAQAALRYGRFYFRPLSAPEDGRTFGISPFPQGVLAFSRILNDVEVLVVANTNTNEVLSVDVIVEIQLNAMNSVRRILYSNHSALVAPGLVRETGPVTVHEVDGTTGHGPLHVIRVTLQPVEVQVLGT